MVKIYDGFDPSDFSSAEPKPDAIGNIISSVHAKKSEVAISYIAIVILLIVCPLIFLYTNGKLLTFVLSANATIIFIMVTRVYKLKYDISLLEVVATRLKMSRVHS